MIRPPALMALATGLVAGPVVSGWIGYRAAVADLDRALRQRPPIAVIDYQPITRRLAAGLPPAELAPGFATLRRQAAHLREHGYLVLNRAHLDAVPDRYLIPVRPVLPVLPDLPRTGAAPPSRPETATQGTIARDEATALIRSLTSPLASGP